MRISRWYTQTPESPFVKGRVFSPAKAFSRCTGGPPTQVLLKKKSRVISTRSCTASHVTRGTKGEATDVGETRDPEEVRAGANRQNTGVPHLSFLGYASLGQHGSRRRKQVVGAARWVVVVVVCVGWGEG